MRGPVQSGDERMGGGTVKLITEYERERDANEAKEKRTINGKYISLVSSYDILRTCLFYSAKLFYQTVTQ